MNHALNNDKFSLQKDESLREPECNPKKANFKLVVLKILKSLFTYIIPNAIIVYLIWIATKNYIITLEGCVDEDPVCVTRLLPKMKEWGIILLLVALLLDLCFVGLYYRIFRPHHIIGSTLVIALTRIHGVSEGWDFGNHGQYNIFFLALFMGMLMIVLMMIIAWVWFAKNAGKLWAGISLGLFITLCVYGKIKMVDHSCDNWDRGFKNTRIIDSGNLCKLLERDICLFDMTHNLFDLSRITMQTCANDFGSEEIINEHYGNATLLAFPNTLFWNDGARDTSNFQSNVLNSMTVLDAQDKYEQAEVILDRKGDHPRIEYNLKRNETVVKSSIKRESQRKSQPAAKNVISVFIDALPRPHFFRKLPKTAAWIENYYDNKISKHESYQFFRYHSVDSHTSATMLPIYLGTDLKKRSGEGLDKHFEEQGFITAQARDMCCSRHVYYMYHQLENMTFGKFHHENVAMFCDPNYHIFPSPHGFFTGAYSSFRRCLYGKDTFQYVLDYGKEFWKLYPDRPKYLEMNFLDQHEATAEVVKYMDDDLSKFFIQLEESNALEDTVIIFYADHGWHFTANVIYDYALKLETYLPAMFIMLPRQIAIIHGQVLKANEQKLIHSYDLHELFETLSGTRQYSGYGIDFLSHIITEERKCNSLFYDCVCA
jgi:hypothetical protein